MYKAHHKKQYLTRATQQHTTHNTLAPGIHYPEEQTTTSRTPSSVQPMPHPKLRSLPNTGGLGESQVIFLFASWREHLMVATRTKSKDGGH